MSVALVTGSHGFVGGHLRLELRSRGWSVVGLGRSTVVHNESTMDYRSADLTDPTAIASVLDDVRPDVVFHLAATTSMTGGRTVAEVVEETVAASRGLGLALRHVASSRGGRLVRVVLAGSSAQYGAVSRSANPVTEDAGCAPVSAYGFAKSAAESVLCGLASDGAFDVIPARAFNHIGPGEPSTTVAGAFADRIRELLAGRTGNLNVADLESVRDFTDVRDIARGYADLAEHGVAGRVYNLCSGRATTVGELLDSLLAVAGLDRSVVEVVPTPPGARSGKIGYQVGSPERMHRELGWSAAIGLEQSTKDLLAGSGGVLS